VSSYFYDQQGTSVLQNLKGFNNASYKITFNKSNSTNSISKKTVTFDSTVQDIKNASNLRLFNNVLALALITIVQNARAQAPKHPQIAKALLNGGIKLLNDTKINKILISQDTYTILIEDITDLINSL
jgi:hypothetical protein